MATLVSKFALSIVIASLLVLAATGNLFSFSPWAIAMQVLAVVLGIWARRSFHAGQFNIYAEPRGERLISAGPYRFIRHPMYTSALLVVGSGLAGHPSPLTGGNAVLIAAVIAARIFTEENFLEARVPGYAEYARRTRRLIPFLL